MDVQPRVQVVLGEAERTDGLLRFVLEGEGFDIIGLASDDLELTRVLRGARPAVIVLDGGISAIAAVEARQSSPGSSLVVIWPDGVSAVLAEERVDPHLVISDLGEAVRRASHRAELRKPPMPMPELLRLATTDRGGPVSARARKAPVRNNPPKQPGRAGRRGGRLLVAAATWMLVVTALATIAVAVPKALDVAPHERAPRPAPSGSVSPRPDETTETPEQTGGTTQPATCDIPAGRNDRADRSDGRADSVRAQGCSPDRGRVTKGARARAPVTPTIAGATPTEVEATTVTQAETPTVAQLEEALGSLTGGPPVGDVPAPVGDVPAPVDDVISISPSGTASLSAIPWSPLP